MTWDDNPEVVIFFTRPDVMSGLFTLVNYNQANPNSVIYPMGAGGSPLIHYPWLEQHKEHHKALLGMFVPSSRPCVPVYILTMALPMKKFVRTIGYMEENFMITK